MTHAFDTSLSEATSALRASESAAAGNPEQPKYRAGTGTDGLTQNQLRYPTIEDLRLKARSRVPRFAFDYVSSGSGSDNVVARNRAAFDDIQIIPRYGRGALSVSTTASLFGRSYSAPAGIGPVGLASLFWPKMDEHLAYAAQKAKVPYVLSAAASAGLERIAGIAPDVLWFQIYGLPRDDHRLTFDLIERAERAGAHALVVTIDTPVRAKRPKDLRNNLKVPFRPNLRTIVDALMRPRWLAAVARHGTPSCESFRPYAAAGASAADLVRFAQGELRGGFTWDLVARIRDRWPRALVIKGILHPADAREAIAIGADGLIVSNHGGRTFDGAPASIDMLPSIRSVAGNTPLLLDSGIRSGLDVARAICVGVTAVLTVRPFLYGVGALGPIGGTHVIELLADETRMALAQIGAASLADAALADVIHKNAVSLAASGKDGA